MSPKVFNEKKNPHIYTLKKNFFHQRNSLRSFISATTLISMAIILSFACKANPTNAEDIYISQNSQGTNSGADCSNAHSIAWFNAASNWTNPKHSGKIGPADTVHFCGTISTTPTVQASGSSGSPITLLWESGAKLSQGHCSNTNGCLNLNGNSYLVLDGGTNGIVEATATGSGRTYTTKGVGILASGSSNLEIKNLIIQNIYVHSSTSDTTDQDNPEGCLYLQSSSNSNFLIHNNVCHDSKWGFNLQYGSGSNIQFYNNDIYNVDHGITIGGYGSVTLTGIKIYNNTFHDYANWDTTSNVYHHDGIHVYSNAGAHANDGQIYNNYFYGNTSTHGNFTAHIYIEKDGETNNNWKIFNNVLTANSGQGDGFGFIAVGSNTGTEVYNNTLVGQCTSISNCYGILVEGGNTIFKNNIITGFGYAIEFYAASPSTIWDYNLYAGNKMIGKTESPWAEYSTFSSWKTYLQKLNSNNEVHGTSATNVYLDSSGFPGSNSAAIGAGANLTSLGITLLDFDKNGTARPSSGAWDIGAYYHNNTSSSSLPTPKLNITNYTK